MTPAISEMAGRRSALLIRRLVLNPSLPWERQRARMTTAMKAARAPKDVAVTAEQIEGVRVEVLRPTTGESKGALVHIHGGGFTVGGPITVRAWAGALCAALDLEVIVPDYRLAPEHPFPAGLDDGAAVLDEVLHRFDPAHVALSGDSAGANLALVATLDRIARHQVIPASLVLLSPWLDLTADRLADAELVARDPLLSPEWLAASAVAYAAGQLDNPRVSPLLGDVSGLPPTLVQGGTDDILAPDAARLVDAVGPTASLSIASPLWHDFALQVGTLRAADEALRVTVDHLTATLAH